MRSSGESDWPCSSCSTSFAYSCEPRISVVLGHITKTSTNLGESRTILKTSSDAAGDRLRLLSDRKAAVAGREHGLESFDEALLRVDQVHVIVDSCSKTSQHSSRAPSKQNEPSIARCTASVPMLSFVVWAIWLSFARLSIN